MQTAGIEVAEIEQDAQLALGLFLCEALHEAAADIEVGPAADIGDRHAKFFAGFREQIFQVRFLGRHLDIDIQIVPETERRVVVLRRLNVVEDLRGPFRRWRINVFEFSAARLPSSQQKSSGR